MASLWLVADDYALSPAVSAGIRQLITADRLSGTGCMTIFPEWPAEAANLKATPGLERAEIGQHLTLTDGVGITGWSVDGSGIMPNLRDLLLAVQFSRKHDAAIQRELDAQLDAFIREWGSAPSYLDGHQHVHFLRPVRDWLKIRRQKLARAGALPWLRGAPATGLVSPVLLKAKVAIVALLARGFDAEMRALGYPLKGPLAGFYDWTKTATFEAALLGWIRDLPEGSLVMCHPGGIDPILESRDSLVQARVVELKALLDRQPVAAQAETS